MDKIQKLRKKIDRIDDKISKLLKKRAKIVIEIGNQKRQNKSSIEDKNRETEIISKKENDYEKNIFKSIISESKKLQ